MLEPVDPLGEAACCGLLWMAVLRRAVVEAWSWLGDAWLRGGVSWPLGLPPAAAAEAEAVAVRCWSIAVCWRGSRDAMRLSRRLCISAEGAALLVLAAVAASAVFGGSGAGSCCCWMTGANCCC